MPLVRMLFLNQRHSIHIIGLTLGGQDIILGIIKITSGRFSRQPYFVNIQHRRGVCGNTAEFRPEGKLGHLVPAKGLTVFRKRSVVPDIYAKSFPSRPVNNHGRHIIVCPFGFGIFRDDHDLHIRTRHLFRIYIHFQDAVGGPVCGWKLDVRRPFQVGTRPFKG